MEHPGSPLLSFLFNSYFLTVFFITVIFSYLSILVLSAKKKIILNVVLSLLSSSLSLSLPLLLRLSVSFSLSRSLSPILILSLVHLSLLALVMREAGT